MSRYIGPKGKINRRLGAMIFENKGATKALDRRGYPPGMHNRRGKQSNYGIALLEKQKIKYYYGLVERQLRKYFDLAGRREGNTGENLLLMCERRLDNVVRRAGFAFTRPQARQGITHAHFKVNGVRVNKSSLLVRPGDVIEVSDRAAVQNLYKSIVEQQRPDSLPWLTVDSENLKITVAGYPGPSDISLPVEIQLVVEFLSR